MSLTSLMGDAVAIRRTPATRGAITRLTSAGRLVRVLPATYVRAGTERDPAVLAAAIAVRDPTAVLTGASAAALHLRRHDWPDRLTFVSPRQWRISAPWFEASRGILPPEMVRRHPIPHVVPALAALQLAPHDGCRTLDRALRQRKFDAGDLAYAAEALGGTPGATMLREIAADSAMHPWSAPERGLHRLLRRSRIRGWRGNALVRANGHFYYLDVGFLEEMLALEVDSWQYHSSFDAFQDDRRRHNDLTIAGWRILRITPEMMDDDPEAVVRWIRRARAR